MRLFLSLLLLGCSSVQSAELLTVSIERWHECSAWVWLFDTQGQLITGPHGTKIKRYPVNGVSTEPGWENLFSGVAHIEADGGETTGEASAMLFDQIWESNENMSVYSQMHGESTSAPGATVTAKATTNQVVRKFVVAEGGDVAVKKRIQFSATQPDEGELASFRCEAFCWLDVSSWLNFWFDESAGRYKIEGWVSDENGTPNWFEYSLQAPPPGQTVSVYLDSWLHLEEDNHGDVGLGINYNLPSIATGQALDALGGHIEENNWFKAEISDAP